MRRLLPLLLVLAASGCGEGGGFGRLAVVEEPRRGPHYIEGSIRFLHVEAEDGDVVFDGPVDSPTGLDDDRFLDREVPAGRYRVRRWERPCQGNCEQLDPPADHCQAMVEVPAGGRVTITVVAREKGGCGITR